MRNTDADSEYDDGFIARLEFKWGEGFLSPGGPDEVRAMVAGVPVAGRDVLDFGCGAGGVDMVLAGELGARSVTGVDIDAGLVARATALAEARGLADRVRFVGTRPGPLPFADASFDLVVSKDAILHVPDKPALYADFARVLRPGGWLAVSDWLKAEGECAALERYFAEDLGLTVVFQTLAGAAEVLAGAGFVAIETADRHDWFRAVARREYEALAGPRRAAFVAAVGEANAAASLAGNARLVEVAETGELRPGHLRGRLPG